MSKKGLLKRAVASLAMIAFGAACEGCYRPLPQDEMEEANPVCTSAELCPDNFDGLSAEDAIRLVQTPEDALKYMNWAEQGQIQGHPFFSEDYTNNGYRTNSFRRFHETHSTEVWDCSERALGTLALLSDNGYPAYFLNMKNATSAHVLPVFKKDGKISTLYAPAEQYDSIDELVQKNGYVGWLLIDLNQQMRRDWKSGDGNYFNCIGSLQTFLSYISKI